ncbi:polysaccharide lyase family 14 protein [Atractiella rhizophila]|nr:polysaccharide lyase family 14 protein [Atractiella rhizophila]
MVEAAPAARLPVPTCTSECSTVSPASSTAHLPPLTQILKPNNTAVSLPHHIYQGSSSNLSPQSTTVSNQFWSLPPSFTLSDLPAAFNFSEWAWGESNVQVIDRIPNNSTSFEPTSTKVSNPSTASTSEKEKGSIIQVLFPQGSVNPGNDHAPIGGAGFYSQPLNLSNAVEVTLSYRVFFPANFSFEKGGKLPGLYGGHPSCSGGRDSESCFSTRLMWRKEGDGELYLYLPKNDQDPELCQLKPKSVCEGEYGLSLGRGSWRFKTGEWTEVLQKVTLNTPGRRDGSFVVMADGKQVLGFDRVFYRHDDSVRFWGIMFQTFFGGHDPDYASPVNQYAYFDKFTLAINDK